MRFFRTMQKRSCTKNGHNQECSWWEQMPESEKSDEKKKIHSEQMEEAGCYLNNKHRLQVNYLHHGYVGMHLIAFSLIFTATRPYGICLKEKKYIRWQHIHKDSRSWVWLYTYYKGNHWYKEQAVGNLGGEERLAFPLGQDLTFLQYQVNKGEEHAIDDSLQQKWRNTLRRTACQQHKW